MVHSSTSDTRTDPIFIGESLFEALPAAPENVLVLLYDRTPDEWLADWRTRRDDTPSRHVLVDACEFTRSTAATTSSAPLDVNGITLDPIEHDASFDADRRTVARYLETWTDEPSETVVIVDSLAWLLGHESQETVRDFVRDVTERTCETGGSTYVVSGDVSAEAEALFGSFFDTVDDLDTSSALHEEIREAIVGLREENPTNYGYLKRNWAEAKRGIEATGRSYPNAKQIHTELSEAESTPRTLGPALKALETLNVIGVWDETVAANRYDLTEYDRRRAEALGDVLEECD